MRFTLEEKVLTLFMEGELNSYNADNVEKEIDETIKGQAFDKLVLDFSHISYISSAGLRIILKFFLVYVGFCYIHSSPFLHRRNGQTALDQADLDYKSALI